MEIWGREMAVVGDRALSHAFASILHAKCAPSIESSAVAIANKGPAYIHRKASRGVFITVETLWGGQDGALRKDAEGERGANTWQVLGWAEVRASIYWRILTYSLVLYVHPRRITKSGSVATNLTFFKGYQGGDHIEGIPNVVTRHFLPLGDSLDSHNLASWQYKHIDLFSFRGVQTNSFKLLNTWQRYGITYFHISHNTIRWWTLHL